MKRRFATLTCVMVTAAGIAASSPAGATLDDSAQVVTDIGGNKMSMAFAVYHAMVACKTSQSSKQELGSMYGDQPMEHDYLDWLVLHDQILRIAPNAPKETSPTRYGSYVPATEWPACEKYFNDYANGVGASSLKVSDSCSSNVKETLRDGVERFMGFGPAVMPGEKIDLLESRMQLEWARYKLTHGKQGIQSTVGAPYDYSCTANDRFRQGFSDLEGAFKQDEQKLVAAEKGKGLAFVRAAWADTSDVNKAHIELHYQENGSEVVVGTSVGGWKILSGAPAGSGGSGQSGVATHVASTAGANGHGTGTPHAPTAANGAPTLPASCTDASRAAGNLGAITFRKNGTNVTISASKTRDRAQCKRVSATRLDCTWSGAGAPLKQPVFLDPQASGLVVQGSTASHHRFSCVAR